MSDRIEGGNATTITFSADAPPEIATGPSDREIIAALARSRADADFCAKSWESEITANNALRGVIVALVDALKPFVHLFSRNMDGADPIAGLPDCHLHELTWAADDDDLDFDEGDKRLYPTITTGQLRRARAALKLAGA